MPTQRHDCRDCADDRGAPTGQQGMYRDGQPIICTTCHGTGEVPPPDPWGERIPASVGEVLLDYSVRAETAAGSLRNALQICEDADVARLIRNALDKIETRGAPPPQSRGDQ